jgi:hypothetical protein
MKCPQFTWDIEKEARHLSFIDSRVSLEVSSHTTDFASNHKQVL